MARLTDRNGSEWEIEILPHVKQLRELHGLKLLKLDDGDPLGPLRMDPEKLVATLFILCESQVDQRKLSPEDFGKAMPKTDVMIAALTDAIVESFGSAVADDVREALSKYAEMASKTRKLSIAKMQRVLDDPRTERALSSETDKEFEKAIEAILGGED